IAALMLAIGTSMTTFCAGGVQFLLISPFAEANFLHPTNPANTRSAATCVIRSELLIVLITMISPKATIYALRRIVGHAEHGRIPLSAALSSRARRGSGP